jgi:hypothetical protein
VPALVTDDGVRVFDSPVICRLGNIGGRPMFPELSAARWRALRLQAMGDGTSDARWRRADDEAAGPRARWWIARRRRRWIGRWRRWKPIRRITDGRSIGAPGYLDCLPRSRRPASEAAAWCEAFAQNPGIADTLPKDP